MLGCCQGPPFHSSHSHKTHSPFSKHLAPCISTYHLWNQHRRAAKASHRKQLKCRIWHSSLKDQRDPCAYLGLAVYGDNQAVLSPSPHQRSAMLIILWLSGLLIFCLVNMAADITSVTKINFCTNGTVGGVWNSISHTVKAMHLKSLPTTKQASICKCKQVYYPVTLPLPLLKPGLWRVVNANCA